MRQGRAQGARQSDWACARMGRSGAASGRARNSALAATSDGPPRTPPLSTRASAGTVSVPTAPHLVRPPLCLLSTHSQAHSSTAQHGQGASSGRTSLLPLDLRNPPHRFADFRDTILTLVHSVQVLAILYDGGRHAQEQPLLLGTVRRLPSPSSSRPITGLSR